MGIIGHAIQNFFLLLGFSLVFGIVFTVLIVKYSKSHIQVFFLTLNYLVAYWFVTLALDISYIYYDLVDLMPALIMLPIAHIAFYVKSKKKNAHAKTETTETTENKVETSQEEE